MSFKFRQGTMDEGIFREVFINNEYELGDLTGHTVLDIGCHIGSFAAKAIEAGASCVVCFEPNSQNFALAQENLSGFSNCIVNNKAVGRSDQDTPMVCAMSDNATNFGGSCTVTDHGVPVATMSLDSAIETYKPSMIKIDAEGAEYPALYTSSLLKSVDVIFGEFHNCLGTREMGLFCLDETTPKFLSDFKGRLNIRSLAQFLKALGYRVLVDNIDAPIGHFWAAKDFSAFNVMAEGEKTNTQFPGLETTTIDFSKADCVYCISLPGDSRRLSFEKHANAVGQKFQWWDAIDGRNKSKQEIEALTSRTVKWGDPNDHIMLQRTTELALILSSIALWENAYQQNLNYLAVMEDDAKLLAPLSIEIPCDADLVFFNNRSMRNKEGLTSGYVCGTDGYLATRAGIAKLLQVFSSIEMAVDLQMIAQMPQMNDCGHCLAKYYKHDRPALKSYTVKPLVLHGNSPSQIR